MSESLAAQHLCSSDTRVTAGSLRSTCVCSSVCCCAALPARELSSVWLWAACWLLSCPGSSRGSRCEPAAHLGEGCRDEWCPDGARCHSVDADVLLHQLVGQRTCEGDLQMAYIQRSGCRQLDAGCKQGSEVGKMLANRQIKYHGRTLCGIMPYVAPVLPCLCLQSRVLQTCDLLNTE
jgi:hypothetical protein